MADASPPRVSHTRAGHAQGDPHLPCIDCGQPLAPILARLGSLRCHDCRNNQLTGALLGASGSTGTVDGSSAEPTTALIHEGSQHRPETPRSALDADHPDHPLTEAPSSDPGWSASSASGTAAATTSSETRKVGEAQHALVLPVAAVPDALVRPNQLTLTVAA